MSDMRASAMAAQVSRHTGLLTATYTLALFLFAPMWGRLSDRRGPHGVLLVGLLGFGVTMFAFSFVENLSALYVGGVFSGIFAAAVALVAAAVIGRFTTTEQERARRLAFLSMASIAGFLSGPMLGVFLTRFAANFFTLAMPTGSVAIPFAATALLTFIASAGVGVFEVGLSLRGKQELGLTPYQIAMMFTECSLVMVMMQAIVFSPRFNPSATRWLISPALAVLAAGLFLVPRASDFTWMMVVIGAVAASAGILSPILTYWVSTKAGNAQGWELGKQTAAASLGVTVGSAAVGLLFSVSSWPGAAFVLSAGLAGFGLLISLRLPNLLVLGDIDGHASASPTPSPRMPKAVRIP